MTFKIISQKLTAMVDKRNHASGLETRPLYRYSEELAREVGLRDVRADEGCYIEGGNGRSRYNKNIFRVMVNAGCAWYPLLDIYYDCEGSEDRNEVRVNVNSNIFNDTRLEEILKSIIVSSLKDCSGPVTEKEVNA